MSKILILLFCTAIAVAAITKKCEPSNCATKCCDQKNVCAKVIAECRDFATCKTDKDCDNTDLYCNKERCSLKATAKGTNKLDLDFFITKRSMSQVDELELADDLSDPLALALGTLDSLETPIANDDATVALELTSSPISHLINWSAGFENHSNHTSESSKSSNETFNNSINPQKVTSKWTFDKEKKVFVWTFSNQETNETKTFVTNSSSLSFTPKPPATNTSKFFKNQSNNHHHHKDQRNGGPNWDFEEFLQTNGSNHSHSEHQGHHGNHSHHGHHHGQHHGNHRHHGHHHGNHGHHGNHSHHGKHHHHHGHHGERHGKHHGHHGRHHHGHRRLHFILWGLLGLAVVAVAIFAIIRCCRNSGNSEPVAERLAQYSTRLLTRRAPRRDNQVTAEMTTINPASSQPTEPQATKIPAQDTQESAEAFRTEALPAHMLPHAFLLPTEPHYHGIYQVPQTLPQTHPQYMLYQAPIQQPLHQVYAPQYQLRYPQFVPAQDNGRTGQKALNKKINFEL